MSVRAIDIVNRFAPNAKPAYREAFANGDAQLADAGITTAPRLAHFMAQVFHETGGLGLLVESGRYNAKNLAKMWDSGNWRKYFASRDAMIAMAQQCAIDHGEALFSKVYGNRMGNGPESTRDGWTYRGRGVMQTTGRESYRRFGDLVGVDFEGNPDLIISAEHALKPALGEWTAGKLNAAADRDDIVTITKRINGGQIGLEGRKGWFLRFSNFLHSQQPLPETSTAWRVQEKLNQLGYSYVHPDGDVGLRTKTAVLDYRLRNGLAAVPTIDATLCGRLGVQ